uniref:hypothetical protein n=1 Tax=Sphingomonas panni TaxID=237612 RepID=UPI0037042886
MGAAQMKTMKVAAIAIAATLGLATTAMAQQSGGSTPGMTAEQHRQMMSGGDQKGQGGMMMNHADMAKMMDRCEKMMKEMGDKPAASTTKR